MTTFFSPDIAEFRSWYVGLTEEKISDVALEGLWDVVKTLLGDGEGNFPYTESEVKPITYAALWRRCKQITILSPAALRRPVKARFRPHSRIFKQSPR